MDVLSALITLRNNSLFDGFDRYHSVEFARQALDNGGMLIHRRHNGCVYYFHIWDGYVDDDFVTHIIPHHWPKDWVDHPGWDACGWDSTQPHAPFRDAKF